MSDDTWFGRLADASDPPDGDRAPAPVKSRVYSAVIATMEESGPLLDLKNTKWAGGHLCVFEHAMALVPAPAAIHAMNPCRICHARVLAERMSHAPIFWPGCPYSEFQND